MLAAALMAVLLAGCGGGTDDRAKVEASLRQYVSTVAPKESGFPLGAGAPRVKKNSCKKIPTDVSSALTRKGLLPKGVIWWCNVTFKRVTLPTLVVLKANGEVLAARP
jgi:hypothetical protein